MGKNAIVGQSGGPTSVINASLAGVFESCKNRGADVVYGMCNGVAGLLEERVVDLSTLQRCASHLASRTDVNEAYAVGGAAAAAAFAGESGRMIALKRVSNYPYQCITESVDVQQVANLEKKVPLEWITPDGMQVTEAFEEYARPLILDEVTPVYVNGTPRHIRL